MDVLIWRGLQIKSANCYEMTVGSTDYIPTLWEMEHSFDLRTNYSSSDDLSTHNRDVRQ